MILLNQVSENKQEFAAKVEHICWKLGIKSSWLMAVMYKESTINHRAVNTTSGATGLIQFMPNTALSLGTTTLRLRAMSNVEQLDYVYNYLRPYRFKFKSYVDVYLAVFFPVAIGKPDDFILQTSRLSAGLIASQNQALDIDDSDTITKLEVEKWALRGFIQEYIEILKKKD
jgi:hypothetical protein